MKPMFIPLCAAALLAAAPVCAQERIAQVPPVPPAVTSAVLSTGRTIGDAGDRVGGLFARGGNWFGRGCADLSVGLGRSCRRAFISIFTDFQEKPVGTPPRYDQM